MVHVCLIDVAYIQTIIPLYFLTNLYMDIFSWPFDAALTIRSTFQVGFLFSSRKIMLTLRKIPISGCVLTPRTLVQLSLEKKKKKRKKKQY